VKCWRRELAAQPFRDSARSGSPQNEHQPQAPDGSEATLEAGFDPAFFAGHSLRSGLATAAKAGKSERSIMKQTGHRSVSVVRRYIRGADLFGDNAAAGIRL
jgi:hypothetical protein